MLKILIIIILLIVVVLFLYFQSNDHKVQSSIQLAPESSKNNYENVDYKTALKTISDTPNLQVVDIRTADEFSSGALEGAINIDFYASDFGEQIIQLDQQKPLLFYCRSGNRSAQALNVLKELSFVKVYHMNKGIINQN